MEEKNKTIIDIKDELNNISNMYELEGAYNTTSGIIEVLRDLIILIGRKEGYVLREGRHWMSEERIESNKLEEQE